MASSHRSRLLQALLLSAFLLSAFLLSASAFSARKVGGRAEIKDVETNTEVQDLGHFAVEEYNHGLLQRGNHDDGTPARLLTFGRVVSAERQLVAGIKYYLRVMAGEGNAGVEGTFDAVVVVKPWMRVRTLVSFGPRSGGDEKVEMGGGLKVR